MNLSRKMIGLLLLALVLMLSIQAVMKINSKPIAGDGHDNILLAYHLAFHDAMSMGLIDENKQLIASNLREPLPIFLSAMWIKAIPSLANAQSFDVLVSGKRLIILKLQNVIYVVLLLIGALILSLRLAKDFLHLSYPLRLLFSILTTLIIFYCIHTVYVTLLITEFQAAMFIVWFVLAWLVAWQSQKISLYIVTGLIYGCLILTKAAFLYIGIVSFLFIAGVCFFSFKVKKYAFNQLIILLVAFITIFPWYVRNYVQIGVWELAQRGPVVLMTRAYKSNLTQDEFQGAFYAYAPLSLKKVMKHLTGFSGADRIEGGRLQRLTRFPQGDEEKRALGDEAGAISYYIKATTHYNNLHTKYASEIKDPIKARIAADQAGQKEAVSMIKNNVIGHLKSTLVFAWRGAWPCNTVDGRWSQTAKRYAQPVWQEIVPFLGLLSMFGLFITATFKKNMQLVILTILGVSTFTFYSLATHFIPRYSEMFIPVWVLCFSVIIVLLVRNALTLTFKENNFKNKH